MSTQVEIQQEALGRAVTGQSTRNYMAIITGFAAQGISADDITPRVNVFTYQAWKAQGRQVRKGQHGVKVCTFIPIEYKVEKDGKEEVKVSSRPRTTIVFHVSQTDELEAKTN